MPSRGAAHLAGVLYLVTFAASIPALLLLAPVLDDPLFVRTPGPALGVVLGCVLDLVNAAACVGTAVVLHPQLRRWGEGVALGFVASRVLEAAIIAVGVVCLLAVLALRTPDASDALVSVAQALVEVRNQTFLLGPGLIPVANALLLGTLLFRSRLVPRWIPVLGLFGAPLLLASALATLFGVNSQLSVWSGVAVLPIFGWELSVGLCLAVRGLRPSRSVHGEEEESLPRTASR